MIGPDPRREIYPNAPLKLVTFELRYEAIDLPSLMTERFTQALADRFPIVGPPPHQHVVIGPSGPPSSSTMGARVLDQGRRAAVALGPVAMSFETSAYRRFEELRESIAGVLEVVESLGLELVAKRVGLRYIDEIDEEGLPEPGAWHRYVQPALSSPLRHFNPPPVEHQSAALFPGDDGYQVVLRYGLLRQPAVDPAGSLVIEAPPRGRYYLIDIDSAWEGEAVARADWLLDQLGALHAPVRHLFESSITDELRNEVLRGRKA